MFQRIIYADWHAVFPIAAFIVAAVFFTVMSWRALRMRRPEVERFARMPLEDEAGLFPDGRSGFIPDASGVKPDLQQRAPAVRVQSDDLQCAGQCALRHE